MQSTRLKRLVRILLVPFLLSLSFPIVKLPCPMLFNRLRFAERPRLPRGLRLDFL